MIIAGGYRDDRRGRGGYGGGGGGGGGGYRGGEENHNNFGMRRDRRDSDRERPERGGRPHRGQEEFREATAGESPHSTRSYKSLSRLIGRIPFVTGLFD